uniref:40S ribosomal protein S17 n=3 Tax=Noccaea caerulescens TaxID=107243 RepID=A0A1J3K3D0_NOCCA
MGRVRTKLVKKAARVIIEKYFAKLTLDFDTNKKVTEEVAQIPSKRVRNQIAGFITHLMKRVQRGPVRGISLKLQEEERERRMDFIPERSILDLDVCEVDQDTMDLLKSLDFGSIHGVKAQAAHSQAQFHSNKPRDGHKQGDRKPNKDRKPREPKSEAKTTA